MKFLFLGLGGLNLLNKAGQSVLNDNPSPVRTYGKSISKELIGASENKQYRINTLAKKLLGCEINADSEHLKYQPLTGVMGTFCEAIKNSKSKALFLVIVFTDCLTSKDANAVVSNNQDFEDFCKYIGLSKDGGTICKLNVTLTIKKVEISLNS